MKNKTAHDNGRPLMTLFLALLSFCFNTDPLHAQFVNIPDPAFRNYIITLDPSAISGTDLDTTNATITSVTVVNVNSMGITDLTGIEYFDNLQSLTCHTNSITSFPSIIPLGTHEFPAGMNYFNCGLNPLQALPLMPLTIGVINVNYCPALSSIYPFPNGAPALTQFLLRTSAVSTLPELKNTKLISLDVDSCFSLTCLPQLPDSLHYLYAAQGGVTCLPNIPTNPLFTSNIGTTLCNGLASIVSTGPTCSGFCDGSVTVAASGSSLVYSWNNGFIDTNATGASQQTGLCAGIYQVSVEPVGGGCPSYAIDTLVDPPPIQMLNTGIVTVCSGSTLCPVITGGIMPLTYLWSDFTSTLCLTPLTSGTYILTVTDMNGCIAQDTFIITLDPPMSLTFDPPVYCSGLPNVVFTPSVSGGAPPYLYLWNDGSTLDHIAVNATGTYAFTITDINGCTIEDSTSTVYFFGPLIAGTAALKLPTCVTCDGIMMATAGPWPGTYTTTFYPSAGLVNISGPVFSGFCADTPYTVLIEEASGGKSCALASVPDSCNLVWPGDANNDGVADNLDLLAIGVGFGSTGPTRFPATNNWVGQPAYSWQQSLASSVNYKHVDCNGDGVINQDDTIPLVQNYGLVHPLKPFPPPANAIDPYLYFDLVIDTVGTSQTLQIPLNLGTAAIPMDSIYGIAFTITYDTALVKADSVSLDFNSSWLGSGNDLLFIQHNDPVNGKLYAAVTRTSHTDTSGYGPLAVFTIVTTDNVSGKLLTPLYDTLYFELGEITAIDHLEQWRPVQPLNDSIIIEDLTAISDPDEWMERISIYPSPASEQLFISMPAQVSHVKISVYNSLGLEMMNFYPGTGMLRMDVNEFTAGVYTISFETSKSKMIRRFVVVR